MKRVILSLFLAAALLVPAQAVELNVSSKSLLLMEKTTGQVLYAQNQHQALEPASVTKIMTLLLVMEAIESGAVSYTDTVPVSAYAASMGGSQVYLEEGEQLTVEEMLKAICVASGNDASVAMAEFVAGSAETFVQRMNQRARELGMENTCFLNCTGLPAEGHVTTAYDVALMSRELILNHPRIREYTTIWMDTLRNGSFTLANTNRLVRFYDGCTGLKTGSTDAAGYCISATAERNGMELIAVVLGGKSSDERFEDAKTLLNYGFSAYSLTRVQPTRALAPILVTLGQQETVQPVPGEESALLLEKGQEKELEIGVELPESIAAPVQQGQVLGYMTVTRQGEELARLELVAGQTVEKLRFGQIFRRLLSLACMAGE